MLFAVRSVSSCVLLAAACCYLCLLHQQPVLQQHSRLQVYLVRLDDFASLKQREALQEETLQLVQQQLQQLQERRQQLLLQLIRHVDAEFRALFSQLAPGGQARLVGAKGFVWGEMFRA